MADVLKHLQTVPKDFHVDTWKAHSSLYSKFEPDVIDTNYLRRYRLRLESGVEYIVNPNDARAMDLAARHARRQLVHHLYGPQLDIANETLHALYAGEDRNQIADRLSKLIESMTEN